MNLIGTETDDEILRKIEAWREEQEENKRLHDEALRIMAQRAAKRLADAMEAEQQGTTEPQWLSLTEQLQRPLNPIQFSIDQLLPLGGNGLFAGRYKAGKTTFNGGLLRSWVDGVPYLGQFDCHPDPDRPNVTIFNYEMSEDQFQRWLMKVGIQNTNAVNIVHLRGIPLPFSLPERRREIAKRLDDTGTGMWIVDPASRAFFGAGDINSNADVANWLGWLDEIKLNAGVRDLILNIHMGHAAANDATAERAIGAQAWSAWADALWYLNFDKKKNRIFWASGRDVELDKQFVHYEERSMGVTLSTIAPDNDDDALRNAVEATIKQNPGVTTRGIRTLAAAIFKARLTDYDQMAQDLVDEGLVTVVQQNGKRHYWADQMPQAMQD